MKNRTTWTLALVSVVLAAASLAAGQTDNGLEVQLKAAIYRELADGDLRAAIEQYEDIVARSGGNRAVAAKALLQMGRAYEKLGRSEARAAYERVLRDYADQPEQVSTARTRLAALEEPSTPGEPAGIVVRQVRDGRARTVSPDGRYVVSEGRVQDLHTGGEHGLPASRGMFADRPVISRDGELVAYITYTQSGSESELRTARLDGSSARVLVRGDQKPGGYGTREVAWVEPFDWLPDGQHILAAVTRQDQTNQIALISVADGSLRVVKSLEWRWPDKMSVSPDGRYIAYDVPDQPQSPQRDIFALATDGSREHPLVEHPARDQGAVWTPAGRGILFLSDRTGTFDLWVLPVRDGRPEGPPEVVRRNVGELNPIGFTRSGNYYYNEGRSAQLLDVYTTSLDAETGHIAAVPTLVSERVRGANTLPEWSPDGQHLAYLSRLQRTVTDLRLDTVGSGTIVVRSVDTGEERELSTQLDFLADTRLRWGPDGRSFLISAEESGGQDSDRRRRGLYQIDAQTGEVVPIVVSYRQTPPEWGENRWHAEWSRDGKGIFYVRDDGEGCEIRLRDVNTGEETLIHHPASPGHLSNLALSPDGRWLAFGYGLHHAAEAVLVIPASGGPPREVLRSDQVFPEQVYSFAWTRDGQHLLFSKLGRPTTELWRVPVEGGEAQNLGLAMHGRGGVRVHSDGRHIAFTNWTGTPAGPAGGLWVMENVLAELEGNK